MGTSSHELIKVTAASAKCAVRSEPVTCLMVASGSMMANRLATAAITTRMRMKGADSSSSIYFVQICAAVKRVIQSRISVMNTTTPVFQLTRTRLKTDHSWGRKKNRIVPIAKEHHNLGCATNKSLMTAPL